MLFWETSGTIEKGHGFAHFDLTHILWLVLFLAVAVISSLIYKKCTETGKRNMRYIVAALLLADELFKIIGLVSHGNYTANYVPLHLCSINIILIAIHAVKPSKLLGQYLYTIGIPATLMALLFPTLPAGGSPATLGAPGLWTHHPLGPTTWPLPVCLCPHSIFP